MRNYRPKVQRQHRMVHHLTSWLEMLGPMLIHPTTRRVQQGQQRSVLEAVALEGCLVQMEARVKMAETVGGLDQTGAGSGVMASLVEACQQESVTSGMVHLSYPLA